MIIFFYARNFVRLINILSMYAKFDTSGTSRTRLNVCGLHTHYYITLIVVELELAVLVLVSGCYNIKQTSVRLS